MWATGAPDVRNYLARVVTCLLLCAIPVALRAQDVKYPPEAEQFRGPTCAGQPDLWLDPPRPCQMSDLQEWLADLNHWKNERQVRVGYIGSQYDRPELKWTQSSFIQPQMMIEDRESLGLAELQKGAKSAEGSFGALSRAASTLSTKAGDLELRIPKLRAGSVFPSLLRSASRCARARRVTSPTSTSVAICSAF